MKLLICGAAVASGLMLASVAMAQNQPATPAAPAAPAAPGAAATAPSAATQAAMTADAKRKAHDAEIICYNDFDTGSHVNHTRICMTRAQREERQKDSQRALEDATSNVPQAPLSGMEGGIGH